MLPLTDRAKQLLYDAQALASARDVRRFEPEDLLLAMARLQAGVGYMILKRINIDLAAQTAEIAQLPITAEPVEPNGYYSVRMKHLIELASEEAAAMNHKYLGTEHFVLALVRDERSEAGAFLRRQSAKIEKCRAALASILSAG